MGRIGDRRAAHGIGGGPADGHVASGGEVGGQAYRRRLPGRRRAGRPWSLEDCTRAGLGDACMHASVHADYRVIFSSIEARIGGKNRR